MIKACLFDFDGTLVDSMPVWGRKMFRILEMTGIPVPDGLLRTITPLGDQGTAAYFRTTLNVPMTDEEMFAAMDEYALPRYREEIPAKEGVADYLAHLKASGVGIYLLTASPHRMFEPCLQRTDLWKYFDACWCCDDFGMVKSNPAIYHAAAQRIGVKPEELMFFDDNRGAVETAVRAGLVTVGVYDPSSAADEQDIRAIAHRYIHNMREMLP